MSKKSNQPKAVKLSVNDVNELQSRLHTNTLTDEDRVLLSGLLAFSLWLQNQFAFAKLSIKKLKKIFGFKTEKKKKKDEESSNADKDSGETPSSTDHNVDGNTENVGGSDDNIKNALESGVGSDETQSDSAPQDSEQSPSVPATKKPSWNDDANHGRYGFDDYEGLEVQYVHHETLKPGDVCPECDKGKVYFFEPGTVIHLEGSPLVTGVRCKLMNLRCNLCLEVFKPAETEELKKQPKYAPSSLSNIAIAHYYYGQPFHRLEHWQTQLGIPLPDSTQYDMMAKLSKQVSPIVQSLEKLFANSPLLYYDDTTLKTLEVIGGHGTAVVSCYEGRHIYLFFAGSRVAGKEVSQLLSQRDTDDNLITMSDALHHNYLTDLDEKLLSKLVVCFCLVHGRRSFFDLLEDYPKQCQIVIDCIAEVYANEAYCKRHQLRPAERLAHHQQHSGPIMDALKTYPDNLWLHDGVEHNSPLGDAVKHMLIHWSRLTRFLAVEGCPLDNTLCERAIKVLIRYRKNSLFYRSIKGALCGNRLMSLIHTAVQNGINAFDYLNTIQENLNLVKAMPEQFLPWNYQATLDAQTNEAKLKSKLESSPPIVANECLAA